MTIIDTLQIPITAEVPKTYRPLTVPINLGDERILTSMWSTLRYAPVAATLQDGSLVFWREKLESIGKAGMKKLRT